VAVWVEDADGFPVRTLVLWLQEGRGARWHRDLTRWYKQDQVRRLVDGTKLIGTVSAATRPPGKYKAVWDGTVTVPIKFSKDQVVCDSELRGHLVSYRRVA